MVTLSLIALALSLTRNDRLPFQWFDGRRWHMLAHQYNSSAPAGKWGQRDDEALGAYAHSLGSDLFGMWETFFATSGKPNSPPPAAYTRTVAFDDGSAVRMLRRERPKVLLDAESKRPTHLFTGVCPPSARSPGDKTCFTMVQRIEAAASAKTDDEDDDSAPPSPRCVSGQGAWFIQTGGWSNWTAGWDGGWRTKCCMRNMLKTTEIAGGSRTGRRAMRLCEARRCCSAACAATAIRCNSTGVHSGTAAVPPRASPSSRPARLRPRLRHRHRRQHRRHR
eukprot:COSAG04_NODE_1484_length_6561_cov_1.862272_1_plen_278_part_10